MERQNRAVWISTAILTVVLQGALATHAFAQPPAPTRELDSPVRGNRYAVMFSAPFIFNGSQANRTITPVVPDGKKLVLQSVSIHAALTDGQSLTEAVVTIVQGRTALARLHVDMDFQAENRQGPEWAHQRFFVGNRDLNMVLNAGESISVRFSRNGSDGDQGMNFGRGTFIGYFVDVDPQTPPSP